MTTKAVDRFDLKFSPVGTPAVPTTSLVCPVGAEIVAVRMPDDDTLIVWMLVDRDVTETEDRVFAAFGDGQSISSYKKIIGTFRTDKGAKDWHIFEV